MPSLIVAVQVSASLENFDPQIKSTGRWMDTPFFSAASINSLMILAPSSSYNDEPI